MIRISRKAVRLHGSAMLCTLLLAACNSDGSSAVNSSSAPSVTVATTTSTAVATTTSTTQPAAGVDPVAFSAATYSVAQAGGSAVLTVTRTGPANADISVQYSTSDASAVAGTDYTAATGTLQWAANDISTRAVTVPISNASPFVGTKTFKVALSNPNAGAQIANPDVATVTISGDAVMAVGSFSLSEASYTIKQSAGSLTVTVNRTGGSAGAVGLSYNTANGSASAGTDFTASAGMLKWDDGDGASKTFQVKINGNTGFSGTRTFTVAVSDPSGGATLTSPSSAQVAILGSASAPVGGLQLAAPTYSVAQTAGSVSLTVTRTNGSSGAISVSYGTGSGTAVAGKEFTAASGLLSWADGDATSKTLSVSVNGSALFSGSKTFTVSLSGPTNGSTIGNPGTSIVTISGSAPPATMGTLQFSATTSTVQQTAGSVTLNVTRTGGSSGAVAVAYATANGSAAAGTDFTAGTGSLQWTDGDTASKPLTVPLSARTPFTGIRTFAVTLSAPTGGATLGSPVTANVSITGTGATSGSDAPAAASNLVLTNQGGANNASSNGASSSSSQAIQWSAAAAGGFPVSHYQIYRNGVAYATTTALAYTDTNATNSNDVLPNDFSGTHFNAPRTVYSYNVAAVDTQGTVGAKANQFTYWEYANGVSAWGPTAFNPAAPVVAMNWNSTSVAHGGSPSVISVATNSSSQYIQPAAGAPGSPLWSFESGAFANGYMVMDIYPTKSGQVFKINIISRVTPGDFYNNAVVYIGSNAAYGPSPMVANSWNHYKIPMAGGTAAAPGLQMGFATFQGYIAGKKLTITAISGTRQINPTDWITGGGMTADYVVGNGPSYQDASVTGTGGVGTYDMSISQTVGSAEAPVTFTAQRTNIYKWSMQDQANAGANLWYLDNIGYTSN